MPVLKASLSLWNGLASHPICQGRVGLSVSLSLFYFLSLCFRLSDYLEIHWELSDNEEG